MTRFSSRRRWRFGVSAFCLVLAASACRKTPAAGEDKAAEPAGLDIPRLPMTTKPELVVREVNGAIDLRRKQLTPKPGETIARYKEYKLGGELVEYLLHRARFLGTVSDYAEALALAERLAAAHGERHADLHIIHARALTSAHRFDDAIAALERARAGGKTESDVLTQRAAIWLARGEPRKTWDALKERSKRRPAPGMVLLAAAALADLGELEGAEKEYRRALGRGHKGAAEPIAEVFFLWGRMWEREGQPARARQLYQLGYDRLPVYAPLVSHLAALEAQAGNVDRAIELLAPIAMQADDPEYEGQMAGLLERSGRVDEAARRLQVAKAGYEALLESQPEAFADHAARFYLSVAKEPRRALELALVNLENRRSDEAYQLVLDAAAAVTDGSPRICEIARAGASRADASAYLLFASSRALRGCGEDALATEALAAAKIAPRAR